MRPSMFNVQVPLRGDDVFLMNTLSDAQLVVSSDVAALLEDAEHVARLTSLSTLAADQRDALATLIDNGFLVDDRDTERAALDEFFHTVREDASHLRVTLLTTLQCNFACGYCYQGDHGDYNASADRMSLATAERVAVWIEDKLDETTPETFTITFFGGEPLLNQPVMFALAERLWDATQARGVTMRINVITNGLLLTPDVVDRLVPYGLNGVKVTLDGDRETHDRMRPLRGGQGTFDRIIDNVRHVAGRCRVSIGGNFDETSAESYPALLDFLKEQEFADKLAKVAFKPIVRNKPTGPAGPAAVKGLLPLTPVGADGRPLNGTCMTAVGGGGGDIGNSPCDGCHFVEEQATFLREETKKRGFATVDGVHMGPCEIHRRHAYTIGPDGALYACPGFTGDKTQSVGHIDGRRDTWRERAADRFEQLAAWRTCGDCSFIPVCAGGCSVASHTELGDMNTPTCHKSSFESALIALAASTYDAACAQ